MLVLPHIKLQKISSLKILPLTYKDLNTVIHCGSCKFYLITEILVRDLMSYREKLSWKSCKTKRNNNSTVEWFGMEWILKITQFKICMSAILALAFIFRSSFFIFFHIIALCTVLQKLPEKVFRKIFILKFSQSKSQVKVFVSNEKSQSGMKTVYYLVHRYRATSVACFRHLSFHNKENKFIYYLGLNRWITDKMRQFCSKAC